MILKKLKFIIITFVLFSCTTTHQYNAESDFEYKIIENGTQVEIIKYIGSNTNVRIPSKIQNLPVTIIGNGAFIGGYWNLEEREFVAINQITNIIIPDSVINIGIASFAHNLLTNVIIPKNVKYIENMAFYDNQLTDIILPNSLTHIGEVAFAFNKITNVVIPNGVIYIGDSAFAGNKITNIIIPDSVAIIGGRLFTQNPLISLTFGSNIELLESENKYILGDDVLIRYLYNNNARAGTYILENGNWLYKSE